jgi:hypothetical protein
MLSRNQEIIKEYFKNIYNDLLVKPCILTSIIIPEKPTKDVVNIIGTFNPDIKIKNITSMPVISINYIDESTNEESDNELKEIYLKEIKKLINKLIPIVINVAYNLCNFGDFNLFICDLLSVYIVLFSSRHV